MALDGHCSRFYTCHATNNQKHAGMNERGWDRTDDQVGTLGVHNSIIFGLLSASNVNNQSLPRRATLPMTMKSMLLAMTATMSPSLRPTMMTTTMMSPSLTMLMICMPRVMTMTSSPWAKTTTGMPRATRTISMLRAARTMRQQWQAPW